MQNRGDLLWLCACGLFGIVGSNLLFSLGTALSSASDAGMMQPLNTIFTTILAVFLRREEATWKKMLGIFLAIVGSVLIALAEKMYAYLFFVLPG